MCSCILTAKKAPGMGLGEVSKSGLNMARAGILSSLVCTAHFAASYEKARMSLQIVQYPKRAGMC